MNDDCKLFIRVYIERLDCEYDMSITCTSDLLMITEWELDDEYEHPNKHEGHPCVKVPKLNTIDALVWTIMQLVCQPNFSDPVTKMTEEEYYVQFNTEPEDDEVVNVVTDTESDFSEEEMGSLDSDLDDNSDDDEEMGEFIERTSYIAPN